MNFGLIIAIAVIVWIGLMPLVAEPVWAMAGRIYVLLGGKNGIDIKDSYDEGTVFYYVFWPIALLAPILIPIFLAAAFIIMAYCICLDRAGHWITKHLINRD